MSSEPILITLVDDVQDERFVIEARLDRDSRFSTAEVHPITTVESFLEELEDPDYAVDLLVVDLATAVGVYGGLKALASLADQRPGVPAVVRSGIHDANRFMYILAAATWFGGPRGPLRAIIPKASSEGLTDTLAGALEGTLRDPLLGFLRDDNKSEPYFTARFHELLGTRSDLDRWIAVKHKSAARPAAEEVGLSENGMNKWINGHLAILDEMTDLIAEDWDASHPGQEIVREVFGNFENGPSYKLLSKFITQQLVFFEDPYLIERFPAV